MMKERIYQVLWIDDDPSDELMDYAIDTYGIELVSKECYSEGIKWLSENIGQCDAVILDVYCKSSPEETPNFESFKTNLVEVNDLCTGNERFIPWFIYTGGPSGHNKGFDFINSSVEMFKRDWDEKNYYDKPSDDDLLFKKVIQEADKSPETRLKRKYRKVLSVDKSIDHDLIHVLSSLESNKDFERDFGVLRDVGVIMEKLRHHLVKTGLLPETLVSGISISKCASFLGKSEMQGLLPQYIQQNIFTCTLTGSEGGHALPAREDVEKGNAPYLTRVIVSSLLSLLYWLSQLDMDEATVMQRRSYTDSLNSVASIKEYEGKSFVVEVDENGTPHCQDCLLPRIAVKMQGQQITLCEIDYNKSRDSNRSRYSLFAKYKALD